MEQKALTPDTLVTPADLELGEPGSPAVATDLDDSFFETRRLRHDGWNGEKMARFCGTLAETGVVTSACRAAGMSAQSAYALRHRNPVFDKAWLAATFIARERLADELLARSVKGGVEQLLRDGAIVAERHTFDNKLAFAILRRLDRRAELGATFATPARADIPQPAPALTGQWQDLLDALGDDRHADAQALLDPSKVDSEVDDPPVEGVESDDMTDDNQFGRVWLISPTNEWLTDFPPPPDFDGEHDGCWGEEHYWRKLTEPELQAVLGSSLAPSSDDGATLEQDKVERDAFFARLAGQIADPPAGVPALFSHDSVDGLTCCPAPPRAAKAPG